MYLLVLQFTFTEKKKAIFSVRVVMKTHWVDYLGLLPKMIIGLIKVSPCEMKLSWIKGRNAHCINFLHMLKEL